MTESLETEEEKRIREWKEERARVAEIEKQKRIDQRDAERKSQKEEEDYQKAELAAKLVPTPESLRQTSDRLHHYHARKRTAFAVQFIAIVVAPVVVFAIYLIAVAVPLYETRAVIAITNPAAEQESGIGGLLGSLQGPSNLQEVFMAHEFVRSDALIEFLEADVQLVSRLSSDDMDPLRRLREFSFLPITVRQQFGRFVESSANIQSGLLTIYVRMPEAEQSVRVSNMILERTAEQINGLSEELFDRRINLAEQAVAQAQEGLELAQLEVVQLQIESGEANPNIRIESIYQIIRELAGEEQALTSEIDRARVSVNSQSYEVDRLTELLESIRQRIQDQRALLVGEPIDGGLSLNSLLTQYELAVLGVGIAEQRLTASIEGLSNARQSAALGQSIFQVVVPPTVTTRPSFPNIPSNLFIATLLALALFGLIRLVLPEQKSF